jgi:hypothetical protein
MQDNPMIAGFGKLRHELAGVKGMAGQLVAITPFFTHDG